MKDVYKSKEISGSFNDSDHSQLFFFSDLGLSLKIVF